MENESSYDMSRSLETAEAVGARVKKFRDKCICLQNEVERCVQDFKSRFHWNKKESRTQTDTLQMLTDHAYSCRAPLPDSDLHHLVRLSPGIEFEDEMERGESARNAETKLTMRQ